MLRIAGSFMLLVPVALIMGCEGAPPESDEEVEKAEQSLLGVNLFHQGKYPSRWVERAFQAAADGAISTLPATRLYAMVDVAMYDAVNGIDRARLLGREPALVPPAGAPVLGLRAAASAAAAHAVLVALVPGQAPVLDTALASDLEELGGGHSPIVRLGRDWGAFVGREVVARRSADGTQSPLNMPASTEPGKHRRTFDARWSVMAPFGIADKAEHGAPPPPALTSALYTASFLDAKANGTHDGNPVHEAIATFWGGDEAGAWQLAAVALARDHGLESSISNTVRLYAQVGMSVADSASVSHAAKAAYYTWRVVPAIHEADSDGNPATLADPAWVPRNGTGNLGSPEYTSGASAFAGGASAAIEHFFCTRHLPFCFETETGAGRRCFANPMIAAKETGRARVLQGVHFQHASDAGIAQGRGVGAEIGTRRLRRINLAGKVVPACSP